MSMEWIYTIKEGWGVESLQYGVNWEVSVFDQILESLETRIPSSWVLLDYWAPYDSFRELCKKTKRVNIRVKSILPKKGWFPLKSNKDTQKESWPGDLWNRKKFPQHIRSLTNKETTRWTADTQGNPINNIYTFAVVTTMQGIGWLLTTTFSKSLPKQKENRRTKKNWLIARYNQLLERSWNREDTMAYVWRDQNNWKSMKRR